MSFRYCTALKRLNAWKRKLLHSYTPPTNRNNPNFVQKLPSTLTTKRFAHISNVTHPSPSFFSHTQSLPVSFEHFNNQQKRFSLSPFPLMTTKMFWWAKKRFILPCTKVLSPWSFGSFTAFLVFFVHTWFTFHSCILSLWRTPFE